VTREPLPATCGDCGDCHAYDGGETWCALMMRDVDALTAPPADCFRRARPMTCGDCTQSSVDHEWSRGWVAECRRHHPSMLVRVSALLRQRHPSEVDPAAAPPEWCPIPERK